MSKKFDIKRTLGNPSPPLSIEAVEEMTQLIHNKRTADKAMESGQLSMVNVTTQDASARNTDDSSVQVTPEVQATLEKFPQFGKVYGSSISTQSPVDKTLIKKPQPTPKAEKSPEEPEKSKRGRKPNPIIDTERLLRVSVDLPESTFIQLKVLVIQQQTDLKSYIRKLVEKDLAKK
jgi:hypothetical protein